MIFFKFYRQLNSMDCGAACLKMIAKFYGKSYTIESLRKKMGFSKSGVSMLGIVEAAETLGFEARALQLSYEEIRNEIKSPCILHWDQKHFVILIPSTLFSKNRIKIADPAEGIVIYNRKDFVKHWFSDKDEDGKAVGTVLLLKPSSIFYLQQPEQNKEVFGIKSLSKYLFQTKWQLVQVVLALIVTSCLQFIFPFLTQSLVDNGINTKNITFITALLTAQLMLIFSRTVTDFIKSRLLLNITMILSLSILSDFWIKLLRLSLGYFDKHRTGDILQRVGDNKQIQSFLSGSILNTVFSFINLFVFAIILIQYNLLLFLIFLISTSIYLIWIYYFLKIRRKINYKTFSASVSENNSTLQLIQGIQDIKLNNAEDVKRWEWEDIQVKIFNLNVRMQSFNQFQQAGALLINQIKDVTITFIVAKLVIRGELSFGAMLAIQSIVGQLSGPVEQIISFIQGAQDTKISIERLNDIHQITEEDNADVSYLNNLPFDKTIKLVDVSFAYSEFGDKNIINGFNLEILDGKTTAIVGVSGSGKTTLLKLLLRFYDSYTGSITVGENDFQDFAHSFWREKCGAVLQDGYIFNDTILKNIIVGKDRYDKLNLELACKNANILSFIESLPNGFNTLIGADGIGISQGQRQRLLIARAIYKNPSYLFLDEATNALDATNERIVVNNLRNISEGRTVVIVAHRLSTVKDADQIIVLENGCVVEIGSHDSLVLQNGKYLELIKNQLEL